MAFNSRKHPRDTQGKFRRAGQRRQPTQSTPTQSGAVTKRVSSATPRKYTNPTKYDKYFAAPKKPGPYDKYF